MAVGFSQLLFYFIFAAGVYLISFFILKKRLPSKSRNVIVLWSVLLAIVLPPAVLIGLGLLLASLFGRL